MQVGWIIVGAVLGAFSFELAGALLGAAVGWLVARSLSQQREIAALRQALERVPATVPTDLHKELPKGAIAVAAEAASASASADLNGPGAAAPGVAAVRTIAPIPPSAPAARAPVPTGPSLGSRARDWLFGGNTVVKAGVGILFIGLAFLAKFASEHVQLPIELRLAGIASVACVLLVLGWRLRAKRAGYAQVLQGGAIAVLYLTLFAAFRFYGVIGAAATFGLMALVAALAAALAVLQNAQSLAAVGALGGFATPILLSTGGGSHIGLAGYYLLLDLGIAAVAWFRTWRGLNLIGFVFSFGVATLWGLDRYTEAHYLSAQLFLIAFFLVFVLVLLLPGRRLGREAEAPTGAAESAESKTGRWVNGSLLFGLPVIAFGLQYGLVRDTPYGVALSALVLAAFYVALATWLRSRPRLALAFEGSLAVGTIFLTLVIPFALDARSTAGAWALEGAGLVWLGWRQQRWLARAFGYTLIVVAGLWLLHAVDTGSAATHWANATLMSGLMIGAGALLAALFVFRHAPRPMTDAAPDAAPRAALAGPRLERFAQPLLIAWALIAWVLAAFAQVMTFVSPSWRLGALLVAFSGLAVLCSLLARRLAWPMVALPVLAFPVWNWLASGLSAAIEWHPFVHGGWWAWPLALAAHGLALRWAAPHWPGAGRHVAHTLGALTLATLGAAGGRGLVQNWGDYGSAWPWLGWLAVPALMLLALAWPGRPGLAARWPVSALPGAYQRSAAALLCAALLLWTLAANVGSRGAAAPLPYVPLVNPLDLGIALALFAAWRWFESAPGRALLAASALGARLPPVLLGGFGFVWLNAMLVRGFHHLAGVPFRFSVWTNSLPVQTGLTLLWTATALPLMWWSARRGRRAPWMVGAALLGAVVLKLLLVDLSASGNITRIVSFIGAGVLMLVIGYVAPMPARAANEDPTHAKT